MSKLWRLAVLPVIPFGYLASATALAGPVSLQEVEPGGQGVIPLRVAADAIEARDKEAEVADDVMPVRIETVDFGEAKRQDGFAVVDVEPFAHIL